RLERFGRANEGAHEIAVHLRSDCVSVDPFSFEEFTRVIHFVDAGGLDVDALKTRALQLAPVFTFVERPRDTSDPQQNAFANFGTNRATRDDVGNREPSAGLQHAKGL